MGAEEFRDVVSRYLEVVRGVYAYETWRNRERRYRRMAAKLELLLEQGKISTASPHDMTPEDVREYIAYCRLGQSPSDMVHEINALKQVLLFVDNNAVDVCLNRNPMLKPRSRGCRRRPPMDDELYARILARSAEIDPSDYPMVRAYAFVIFCLNTGCRNKEARLAVLEDLDTQEWMFDIVHVKGETSYGQPRKVPVPPDARPIIELYLEGRERWLAENNVDSPALFPSRSKKSPFLTGNSLRKYKVQVEEDLGVTFDLRQCRRTFGQRYLDNGLDIESTSVLMGHASTKTTEQYYSRRKLDQAVESAKGIWDREGRRRLSRMCCRCPFKE